MTFNDLKVMSRSAGLRIDELGRGCEAYQTPTASSAPERAVSAAVEVQSAFMYRSMRVRLVARAPTTIRRLNQLVSVELTTGGAVRWQLSWSHPAALRYPPDGFEDLLEAALDATVADQPDTEPRVHGDC